MVGEFLLNLLKSSMMGKWKKMIVKVSHLVWQFEEEHSLKKLVENETTSEDYDDITEGQ